MEVGAGWLRESSQEAIILPLLWSFVASLRSLTWVCLMILLGSMIVCLILPVPLQVHDSGVKPGVILTASCSFTSIY